MSLPPPAIVALTRPFQALPPVLRAAIWMVLACAFFAALNAIIRHMSQHLDPLQVVFLRNAGGLLFMLPWLMRVGFAGLATGRLKLYLWRTAISLASMFCWFTALATVPLAQAIALSFAAPLFATVLAAVFLREEVRARRWSATLIGFVGVLVILRPWSVEISAGVLFALASAALMSVGTIVIKQLSRTESTEAVVAYMVLLMTPLSLPTALWVWEWPTAIDWLWVLGLGFCGTLGHLCFVRALQMADASAVMPYDYSRLPFSALIGWLAFSEIPDRWLWIGSAIIAAAAIYITRREAQLARQAAAKPATRAGVEAGRS